MGHTDKTKKTRPVIRCERCQGCLKLEQATWRSRLIFIVCVNCGDRTDHVIQTNRQFTKVKSSDVVQRTWSRQIWDRIQLLTAQTM